MNKKIIITTGAFSALLLVMIVVNTTITEQQGVDFEGYVWISLIEPMDGANTVEALQNKIAYVTAIDDVNRKLEQDGADWRMAPRIDHYDHTITESLASIRADGDALLTDIYGSPENSPYGFQVLAIVPGDYAKSDDVITYVDSHEDVIIAMAGSVDEHERIFIANDGGVVPVGRVADIIETVTGQSVTEQSLATYDSVWLYGLAIEKAGTLRVDEIAKTLPTLDP